MITWSLHTYEHIETNNEWKFYFPSNICEEIIPHLNLVDLKLIDIEQIDTCLLISDEISPKAIKVNLTYDNEVYNFSLIQPLSYSLVKDFAETKFTDHYALMINSNAYVLVLPIEIWQDLQKAILSKWNEYNEGQDYAEA